MILRKINGLISGVWIKHSALFGTFSITLHNVEANDEKPDFRLLELMNRLNTTNNETKNQAHVDTNLSPLFNFFYFAYKIVNTKKHYAFNVVF